MLGLVILGYILVAILIIAGLVFSAVNLPGIWLVFAGALIAAAINGFNDVGWGWIAFFLLLAIAGSLLDNLVVLLSTKKFGAGKWGIVGAIVGMIVGFFVGGLVGVIVGPFIGVVLFEMLIDKKEMRAALKSGLGTVVGFILSIFLKFGLSMIIVGVLLVLLLR